AEPVESDASDGIRKSGEQQRHAGDVAIVLAGLVRAAEIDLVERRPVDLGIALDQRPDGDRGEIVGAHFGERAAIAADRGSGGIADERFGHAATPTRCFAAARAIGRRPARECVRLSAACRAAWWVFADAQPTLRSVL